MGATAAKIRQIFLSEGLLLAGVGGLAGVLLAVLICWLQINFHLLKLQGGSFIIDYYPVKMNPADFGLVTATVVLVAVLAAWLPARKASQQDFSLKS
jgi:lipoprotein-releasing system permease protein